jgi:hypothetical protein
VVGAWIDVSGTTVKRVERLARNAPELLQKVASGELSVKTALKRTTNAPEPAHGRIDETATSFDRILQHVWKAIKAAWTLCPMEYRARLVARLQRQLGELGSEAVSLGEMAQAANDVEGPRATSAFLTSRLKQSHGT